MLQQARLIRTLLLATASAGGLVAAGHWTPALAQPAAMIRVKSPSHAVAQGALAQAIRAADKFSGGKVVEIRYRLSGTKPGFDAVTAKGGAYRHVRIDLPSNKVSDISQSEIPWAANWQLKADAKSLAKAKLGLADAVAKAEQIAEGPAVDAGVAAPLNVASPIVGYNVEVAKGGGERQRVVIDAISGQRIGNPGPFLEPWAPEKSL